MITHKTLGVFLLGVLVTTLVFGCVEMKGDRSGENITFTKAGEFKDRRGQATIKLYTYAGAAELDDIKSYAGTLGCGMLYAYFYPADTLRDEMPVDELQTARSFTHAQEILFQGEGYAKWHYAAQCLGLIPTVTDCQATPLSTNCR